LFRNRAWLLRSLAEALRHRAKLFRDRAEVVRRDAEVFRSRADSLLEGATRYHNIVEAFSTRSFLFSNHHHNTNHNRKEQKQQRMALKVNVDKVAEDAAQILRVWETNPDFKMKEVVLADFQSACAGLNNLIRNLLAKDQEATVLRNERDDLAVKVNELCTRARSGMKGFFGPNSSQYEQAGGTRAVERKMGIRKPAKPGEAAVS
jgi:hypothetical protein